MHPRRPHARIAAALVMMCAAGARAGDGVDDGDAGVIRLSYTLTQPPSEAVVPAQGAETPAPGSALPARFGTAGQSWFTFGPGIAYDLGDNTDINLRGAYSYFLVDDLEFSVELNGWYHAQAGDDAMSINPAIVFRWHHHLSDNWTAYVDAGIGVLVSTNEVPEGGTNVNFTPRVGGGLTCAISDTARLQMGLRWHHISNARITGDRNNPARDAPMVYVGVMIPF